MITLNRAALALKTRFGEHLQAPRLPGKTILRDALCEEFEVSQAEAESVCDSLEQLGAIRFAQSPEHGWVAVLDPSAVSDEGAP